MNRATRDDIIEHYGDGGYEKILDMGYENKIMKNYKDEKYNGIKNYYPEGLSVEDIDNYIKYNGGIDAQLFKKFTCDVRDTNEYLELSQKIRDRQLFETKLGIRYNLGNEQLANITTTVLNKARPLFREDGKYMQPEEMERAVSVTDVKASQIMEERDYEIVHDDLVTMKTIQDEWFDKIPLETIKKVICVNIPTFACFIGTLYGCAIVCGSAPAPICGGKKRKSKRKKSVKKKKTTRKRKTIKRKNKRKTKRRN